MASPLFCDIGNSFAHFFDGERSWREPHQRLSRYADNVVYYINVKVGLQEQLAQFAKWIDLEPHVHLPGAYPGMGIDRQVLLLAVGHGVAVDAGSAITVDRIEEGIYQGGFIYPGLAQLRQAYRSISPRLDHPIHPPSTRGLPKGTREAIGYGALVPLLLAIESLGGAIYVTGGDGAMIADLLDGALYDGNLIFKGMALVKEGLC
ncbi:MAG: pantothenate kinase [Nitratiruptor sp.]|nr:pantothenate kinase [Nitratiruptor sp.]NPA83959.1 type III pantothenate kinase [Campylobacterota bacterium]